MNKNWKSKSTWASNISFQVLKSNHVMLNADSCWHRWLKYNTIRPFQGGFGVSPCTYSYPSSASATLPHHNFNKFCYPPKSQDTPWKINMEINLRLDFGENVGYLPICQNPPWSQKWCKLFGKFPVSGFNLWQPVRCSPAVSYPFSIPAMGKRQLLKHGRKPLTCGSAVSDLKITSQNSFRKWSIMKNVQYIPGTLSKAKWPPTRE